MLGVANRGPFVTFGEFLTARNRHARMPGMDVRHGKTAERKSGGPGLQYSEDRVYARIQASSETIPLRRYL